MRILYIANHDCGGNDDEGAIGRALRELGHVVDDVHENHHWPIEQRMRRDYDLLLFHKWAEVDLLRKFSCPKVFWYFDLVDSTDPTLARRDEARRAWMKRMIPEVTLGFCTDGDWVAQWNSGRTRTVHRVGDQVKSGDGLAKLVWLTQGADGAIVGRGTRKNNPMPILFTGIGKGGGRGREEWLSKTRETWREDFTHVRSGLHREALRDAVAGCTFYACPDSPVTNLYWSNRVYNAAGFGAVILHPRTTGLYNHYTADEIFYYSSSYEFDAIIREYAGNNRVLKERSERALERTKKDHLYLNRVRDLLETLREKAHARANLGSSLLEGEAS